MALNLVYAHLVRDMEVEDRAKFDDSLDAPLTRTEVDEDEDWVSALNRPAVLDVDKLDPAQRAFLQARGVLPSDGSSS